MPGSALFCGRQIKKIRLEIEDIFYIIAVIEKILCNEIVCTLVFFAFSVGRLRQKVTHSRGVSKYGRKKTL
jgi:hypothetical protein